MRLSLTHLTYMAALCLTLLVVAIWSIYSELDRQWKHYQEDFYAIAPVEAGDVEPGIKQIWLPDEGITDRCMTCHMGADIRSLDDLPLPFSTHSGDYLREHPPEKFGCISCHEGQGEALTVEAAHGEEEYWRELLLKGSYTQASCGSCHSLGQNMPSDTRIRKGEIYSEGWRLFNENNCIGCHKLENYRRPDHFAPSLNNIGSKVTRQWLIEWLKNPKKYYPQARMPRFRLTDENAEYVADYLLRSMPEYTRKNPEDRASSDKLIAKGRTLINSLGCLGCHKINRKGVAFGPDFSDTGNKLQVAWLYEFLKNPKAYDPKTIIPVFNISEEEIKAIVAYLMSLKVNKTLKKLTAQNESSSEGIRKGKELIKDLGCNGCHEIKEMPFRYVVPDLGNVSRKRMEELFWGNIEDNGKTLIDWLMIKVSDPGGFDTGTVVSRMPDYNFSKDESEALVTFLLSLKKEALPSHYVKALYDETTAVSKGRVLMERYNCIGCHMINKVGGSIGPDLTHEAKKSRPEWLFNFLKKPVKIRPPQMLKAGMPDFALSDQDVNSVIEYFSDLAKERFPFISETREEIYMDDIRTGEKLYHEIFACIGCHRINGQGGEVGPDHTNLSNRLRRQWIEQWLRNPQAVKPDVRMPRFDFKDWEFEALINYLETRGMFRFVQPRPD